MKESHDMLYKLDVVGYFTTFNKNGKQELPKFKVFVCVDDFAIPHMYDCGVAWRQVLSYSASLVYD